MRPVKGLDCDRFAQADLTFSLVLVPRGPRELLWTAESKVLSLIGIDHTQPTGSGALKSANTATCVTTGTHALRGAMCRHARVVQARIIGCKLAASRSQVIQAIPLSTLAVEVKSTLSVD